MITNLNTRIPRTDGSVVRAVVETSAGSRYEAVAITGRGIHWELVDYRGPDGRRRTLATSYDRKWRPGTKGAFVFHVTPMGIREGLCREWSMDGAVDFAD